MILQLPPKITQSHLTFNEDEIKILFVKEDEQQKNVQVTRKPVFTLAVLFYMKNLWHFLFQFLHIV